MYWNNFQIAKFIKEEANLVASLENAGKNDLEFFLLWIDVKNLIFFFKKGNFQWIFEQNIYLKILFNKKIGLRSLFSRLLDSKITL